MRAILGAAAVEEEEVEDGGGHDVGHGGEELKKKSLEIR